MSLRYSIRARDPHQSSIVTAIRTITHSVSKMLEPPSKKRGRDRAEPDSGSVGEICTVTRHVYPSILRGMEAIQPQKVDDEIYIPALVDVVKLFQAFLGRLHQIALDQESRRQQEAKSKKKGGRPDGRSAKRSTKTTVELDGAKDIARMLIKMITMLDVSQDVHSELLEGFLCALLDHLGSSLSFLVFADPQSSRNDQDGILTPKGLLDVAHLDIETATDTIGTESPFLIWVLRQATAFLHENAKVMSGRSLSLFSLQDPSATECSGKDLRRRIEETLQNTLLRGVFGDDDDTFFNSLRREDDVEEDMETTEAELSKMLEEIKKDEGSPEWFIGQLWEHLGWDILSGKRGV